MQIINNYSLRAHNTFGIDARCHRFVELNTVGEVVDAVSELTNLHHEPLLIVGSGSNLLLTGDYAGTVVHSAIQGMHVDFNGDDILVTAGSGMQWDHLAQRCTSNGWYGTENLALIPGELGAAAVQNIGAYGAEAAQMVSSVEAVDLLDGSIHTLQTDACGYGYRESRFKHEWRGRYLITHVTLRLSRHFAPQLDYGNIRSELERAGIHNPTAQQLRDVIAGIRRAKLPDPQVTGNAGSFFMNPVVKRTKLEELQHAYGDVPHYMVDNSLVKIPAAWLIEQCGWKGRTLGHAAVHSRQPLVLVNLGAATGGDIVKLCQAISHDVAQHFGITLQPEVNIV